MNRKDLVDTVTKMEGKKKQISRAQAEEIVGIFSDLAASPLGADLFAALYENGKKREGRRQGRRQ